MNGICEKYFGLIEDLIEGELDGQIAAETKAHVFDCAECRNEYELLQREKEVLSQYLFEFEPPTNSWANVQKRLDEETEAIPKEFIPVATPSGRKRIFAFGFSPAFAALGVLLLVFGIGLVWLKRSPLQDRGGEFTAETKPENTQTVPSGESIQNPTNDLEMQTISANDARKSDEPLAAKMARKNPDLLTGKKLVALGALKIKRKSNSSGDEKKQAIKVEANNEMQAALMKKRNLETEIAGQIEKIEMLLRSFRNARESGGSFDVDYEIAQARRLLEASARLRRTTETGGVVDGAETLSRVEPYMLEIANLGDNPAPDRILDIKERISNQNVIANLQVYSSAVAMR